MPSSPACPSSFSHVSYAVSMLLSPLHPLWHVVSGGTERKRTASSVISPSHSIPELWQVRGELLCGPVLSWQLLPQLFSPSSSISSTVEGLSKATPCVKRWDSGQFMLWNLYQNQSSGSKLVECLKIANWSRSTGLEKIVNTFYNF